MIRIIYSWSLRGGSVEVTVAHKVKWPHEYVLAGNLKDRISYNQLSMGQWMAGFCRIMKGEQNSENREAMLDYLIGLLDDSNDFSWDAAKACHAVLLCRMEHGEVKSYCETDKLDRIRRANAQRHIQPATTANAYTGATQTFKGGKTGKTATCNYFNQGTCNAPRSHETKGVMYKHACSFCFSKTNKYFAHSLQECRSKNKQTKNE